MKELKTLSQLKKDFELELEQKPNKEYFIDNEIRQVMNFVYSSTPRASNSSFYRNLVTGRIIDKNKNKRVFQIESYRDEDIFYNAFESYLQDEEYQIDKSYSESELAFEFKLNNIKQAIELAKYYQWLKELKTQLNSKPKQKKSTLSHQQKMLALYYLGIDMRKFLNNVQSAKILSSILDLDESNTKDFLTYFDGKKPKVKINKNIMKVLDLFEHQDFKEISSKIKEDL